MPEALVLAEVKALRSEVAALKRVLDFEARVRATLGSTFVENLHRRLAVRGRAIKSSCAEPVAAIRHRAEAGAHLGGCGAAPIFCRE
jgi:hypothetical protein